VYQRILNQALVPEQRARTVCIVFAISAAACGADGRFATNELASHGQAILGGEPSGPEEDAVVLVDGELSCSATLVAPDVVVTALHCVAEFKSGPFLCGDDGNLQSPEPEGVLGATFAPESIAIHVGAHPSVEPAAYAKKVFRSGAKDICKQDIAVVVLDRELELPLSMMRLKQRIQRGERMRAVGYGANGVDAAGRYSRGGLRVTDVGKDANADADGRAAPYTFVLTEGPCQGDSGGPAFSEETGALAGVYSISASSSCDSLGIRNIYTSLAPFEDLILQAFEFAGREPLLEPGTNSADAGGGAKEPTVRPEDEDGGSGSRRESSCAFTPTRAVGSHAPAMLTSALLALVALRRLSRRLGR
jgi:hypothetical protein